MNDDLTTLASAYLDGATSDAERARVERDAELLAEVERMRQVRAVLGDTEPAPISTRERHLAAALDAFDRLPTADRLLDGTPPGADAAAVAGAATVIAPASLDDRRRLRASRRILAVAAGLVVVLGGGLVARDALRSTDDDSGGSDATAQVEDASSPLEARTGEAFDLADGDVAEDAASDEAAAEALPPVIAGGSGETDTFIGSDEAPPDDGLTVLASEDDLAAFAELLLRESPVEVATDADAPAATLAPAFELCGLVDRIVGPALWETDGLFDTPVVVGIDDGDGEVIAYDDETCNVVARTPLRTP